MAASPLAASPLAASPLAVAHFKQSESCTANRADPVDWYDRTIAADPKQFYAYFHKAKALETAGRSKDALAVLRDGLPRARAAGDFKAASEIEGYLDELE
jgi:thioredoxin-like negative regulator of GroEL